LSITSRGWMLGLGCGSASGGLTSQSVETSCAGAPSSQSQAVVRSSLPGSVVRPLNGTATPMLAMNVGTPLTSVVPVSSIVAVGVTLPTDADVETHVPLVSSSDGQTVTVNVPSSP
jgi:hypothetical protein